MKKKKIVQKLRNKYRLIIYNDTTFQSVFNAKLTRIGVFAATASLSAFMLIIFILLISKTSLKEYIPGYPNAEYRKQLIENRLLVDSLEKELTVRDKYLNDIKKVISGNVPTDYSIDTLPRDKEIKFKKYNHDSIFEDQLLAEKLNLSTKPYKKDIGLNKLNFFVPVKGVVTNDFDYNNNHFGIDVVSKSEAIISSALDGTVIFSGWTLETGHVLYIQHQSSIITVYKHNAELLKKTGDQVKAGEAIAVIGNSGNQTTGPHLHFELWHDMKPLNPKEYIDF